MAIQRRRIKETKTPIEEADPQENYAVVEEDEAVTPRPAQRQARTDERDAGRETPHKPARTRRRKAVIHEDIFYIPLDEIPDDLSYEWKRWSNVGEENPFYIAQLREQGWEPVPPSRHPNWVPPGYTQPHIIKGGQILMDRPKELTEEARAENRQLARRQIREAEQRLGMTPKDTLTRQHEGINNRVVKEIGRMVPTAIES